METTLSNTQRTERGRNLTQQSAVLGSQSFSRDMRETTEDLGFSVGAGLVMAGLARARLSINEVLDPEIVDALSDIQPALATSLGTNSTHFTLQAE